MNKKTRFLLSAVAVLMALCGCKGLLSEGYTSEAYGYKVSYPGDARMDVLNDSKLLYIGSTHPHGDVYYSIDIRDYAQDAPETFQLYEQGLIPAGMIVWGAADLFIKSYGDSADFQDFQATNYETDEERGEWVRFKYTYTYDGADYAGIYEAEWHNDLLYKWGGRCKGEIYDTLIAIHESFTIIDQ